jgi:hypothetical protein
LDAGLGGPQSRSGRFGEEKILDPTGTRNADFYLLRYKAKQKSKEISEEHFTFIFRADE